MKYKVIKDFKYQKRGLNIDISEGQIFKSYKNFFVEENFKIGFNQSQIEWLIKQGIIVKQ